MAWSHQGDEHYLNVVHWEHMGVGVILSEAMRRLGVNSTVLASSEHPFGFKPDHILYASHPCIRGIERKYLNTWMWGRFLDRDILHSHDNMRLPQFVVDRYKGRFIQHYHDPKTREPLFDCPSLVSLPSILKAVPDGTWIPLPAETELFKPHPHEHGDRLVVGFNNQSIDPTKPQLMPLKEIKEAESCLNISLKPLESVIPHFEMPGYYSQLDLWVDRFDVGFYGFSAIEAASMGVPVVCQIGEEELTHVQGCPFLSLKSRGELVETLRMLSDDEALRRSLGEKSRRFILDKHDSLKVAKECLNKYEEIMRR